MKKTYILLLLSIILLTLVSSEQIQQSNKIFLEPFYRESMDPDTPYTYTLNVNPPDKVSSVSSAIITFSVWHNPSIRYTLTINGQPCNNPSFYVSTSYENAGNNEIYFDCSNVINSAGSYEIILTPDDDTGSITGWVDLTYTNKPRGSLLLHGTEYLPGQNAKVWLQLLDSNNTEVNNGFCLLDIYSPDNNIDYLEDASMNNLEHDGVYVYDLIAPQQQGVYPAIAKCYYEAIQIEETADSFNLLWGDSPISDYTDTFFLDLNDHEYREIKSGTGISRINFTYTFNDVCGTNISEQLLTGITIETNQDWDSVINDDVIVHIYNFTNNDWLTLNNKIESPNNRITVSNSIEFNNITKSGLVNSTGSVILLFNDSNLIDTSKSFFKMDYLSLKCNQFATPEWTEVKGSSELHISSEENYVNTMSYGELTNETFINDFTFHFTVSSQASVLKEDEEVSITLLRPFECNHVLEVNEKLINGTVLSLNYTGITDSEGKCEISIDHDLDVAENYDIEVVNENHWKIHVLGDFYNTLLQEDIINVSCQNYAVGNGFDNYTIPIVNSNFLEDNLYISCNSYLDASEHYKETVQQFLNMFSLESNFTLDEMLDLESEYLHLEDVRDRMSNYAQTIVNGLGLVADYSTIIQQNPLNFDRANWTVVNSLFSASYQNYLKNATITGASVESIWEYNNRSLTDFDFDVVNETEIAEEVWNYSGTINPNILSQISINVWNFTGTISANIIDTLVDAFWSNVDRNLTTTEDVFNYSALVTPEQIWNYTTRELTGEESLWVGGTEYSPDETTGKVVVRLVGSDKDPVLGANCTLYILYPNNTIYLTRQMIEATGVSAGGIYYDDFPQSGEIGVHPYAVNCIDAANKEYFMLDTYHVFGANRTEQAREVWEYINRTLTFYENFTAPQVDLTNYELIQAMTWNFTGDRNLTYYEVTQVNETSIALEVWSYENRSLTDFEFTVDTSINLTDLIIDIWNYTFRNLTEYQNFSVPQQDLTNYTLIQDLVWSATERTLTEFNFTVDVNQTLIAEIVWNATVRTLSSAEDVTNYTLIEDLITQFSNNLTADEIWSFSNRSLTYYENFSIPLQDLTNYTLIQELVWDATERTLTDFNFTVDVNETLISDAVWSATVRTLTDYNHTDLTNYTLIGNLVNSIANNLSVEEIWSFSNRSLTYYENFSIPLEDLTNYELIQDMVWNASNRELTEFNFTVDVNLNVTEIAEAVWNYGDRNLTFYETNNITPEDVWNYVDRNLTYYENFSIPLEDLTNYNLIQEIVWNATERTLTEFNFTVDVNQTLIAETIWNATSRTLTEIQDATNYTLIQELINNFANNLTAEDIWNYGDRNLTYYENFTIPLEDLTNYELIQAMVWNNTNRNLTFYEVTEINTTSIAVDVWDYNNRTLTFYELNDITPQDIWQYSTRNLTYYELVDVSNLTVNVNATEIAEQVWSWEGSISNNIIKRFGLYIQCVFESVTNEEKGWGIEIPQC